MNNWFSREKKKHPDQKEDDNPFQPSGEKTGWEDTTSQGPDSPDAEENSAGASSAPSLSPNIESSDTDSDSGSEHTGDDDLPLPGNTPAVSDSPAGMTDLAENPGKSAGSESVRTDDSVSSGGEDDAAGVSASDGQGDGITKTENPGTENPGTENPGSEETGKQNPGSEPSAAEVPDTEAYESESRKAADHKPEDAGHDFDDEPKFDTQTGEPLSKPKSKAPGILLTIIVTACVVGAVIAAFINKDTWNPKTEEGGAEVETEPLKGRQSSEEAAESSATEASLKTAGETGADETRPETQEKAAEKRTQKESQTEETSAASQKAALQLAGGETSSESETETETEPETDADSLSRELSKDAVSLNTSLDVSDVAEKGLTEVVSVTSQSVRTVQSFFYGEQQIQTDNVGSGIIIDEDSDCFYIVTDANLTAQAENVTVGFSTGQDRQTAVSDSAETEDAQTFSAEGRQQSVLTDQEGMVSNGSRSQREDSLAEAEVIGADAGTELAVLAVKKSSLPDEAAESVSVAVLGDSDSLKIGQRVVAIGDSLGYGQSVTQGIISALNRTMQSTYGTHEYIQTDASINYGNYGGALLNLSGEVIGINSGKASSQGAEGMGYALPVNDAKKGIESILAGRGNGLKTSDSAGETETGPQSEAAALESAESETEAEEQTVITAPSGNISPAEETDGQSSESESGQSESTGSESSTQGGLLGVRVGELSEVNQIVYRVPAGVFVVSVEEGSGAAAAGIQENDVITSVNGQTVTSISELRSVLADTKAGDQVKVEYVRPDSNGKYTQNQTADVTLQ